MMPDLQGKTIAITGATGFLGAHLALAGLACGAKVRAVVRTPAKAAWLAELGVEIAKADLSNVPAMTEAFAGVDAVIANAARTVAKGGSFADSLRDNRDGANNQLVASSDAGVDRVIYVSTIAVYATRLLRKTDETAAMRDPDRRPMDIGAYTSSPQYSRSKAAAEIAVWERVRERNMRVTSLRPGPIYGPGWSRLNQRYRDWSDARIAVVPTFRFPHVHAADCAHAAMGALMDESSVGEVYNLAGPLASPYGIVGALTRHRGRGPVRVPLVAPLWLALDDSKVEGLLGRPLRRIEDNVEDLLSDDVVTERVTALYSALHPPSAPE